MTDLTNIVEMLAKQALGGQQTSQSGLGGILSSVVSQFGSSSETTQSNAGGLSGMLGSVLNQFTGSSSDTAGNGDTSNHTAQTLLLAVVPVVLGWIQQQGGLQGALEKLESVGLGSQLKSWVDPNQDNSTSVSNEHVEQLFDDKDVEQIAEQTQQPKQNVLGAISAVLPQIVNSLTPQGNQTDHQEANQDIQNVLSLVSGFLKK